jgi:segregation and condensation protein B
MADRTDEAPPPLHRLVEAMLFIGGAPLTAVRAAEALRGLPEGQFLEIVDELNRRYRQQNRPYRIRRSEDGFELALQPPFRIVQERLSGSPREARLSQAALDVLALVAYRQPTTRQELESQRGGDCGALLRQLVRLGLVAVEGSSYGTTARFLSLFGLRSLDDLPRTQDLQKM